ncbi:MAG TPA: SoxR reducing system RseC family protein [Planctomycetota bacterium]|nr:SoxR reducing system RseC family protein [Planctomycetota bacterium]
MKEIGRIIEFTSEGKAVVEFETKRSSCNGCACGSICKSVNVQDAGQQDASGRASGEKKRMVMEVIPGVALGSRVYVEIGRPSLLRLPTLVYVMVAAFLAGALLGQIIAGIARSSQAGMLSIMAGLIVTAVCIVALNIDEHRRSKETFTPYIIGIIWRASS